MIRAAAIAATVACCAPPPCSRPAVLRDGRCWRLTHIAHGWVLDHERQRALWRIGR